VTLLGERDRLETENQAAQAQLLHQMRISLAKSINAGETKLWQRLKSITQTMNHRAQWENWLAECSDQTPELYREMLEDADALRLELQHTQQTMQSQFSARDVLRNLSELAQLSELRDLPRMPGTQPPELLFGASSCLSGSVRSAVLLATGRRAKARGGALRHSRRITEALLAQIRYVVSRGANRGDA
jgi:hypothetical protein